MISDYEVNTATLPHTKTTIGFVDEVNFDPLAKGKGTRSKSVINHSYEKKTLFACSLLIQSKNSAVEFLD